jgi:hypothetical protein
MLRNRRSSIIVVGGALAVASVGYGLGTQADDGTAVADSGSDRGAPRGLVFERGAPPGCSDLADKLGVSQSELQDAFRAFHEQEHGDRQTEFGAALAKALDVPAEKVTSALDQIRDRHETRFANRLAQALGADADEVKAALDKIKGDGPVPFGDFAAQLADELGLDESDVEQALMDVGPGRGPDGDGDDHVRGVHHVMPLRQLATALDVSRADLRKALRELRPDGPAGTKRFEEHQQELAKFLADRLDLDVDKVTSALADLPRPTPPAHGDRPGPGGPGAFGPPL